MTEDLSNLSNKEKGDVSAADINAYKQTYNAPPSILEGLMEAVNGKMQEMDNTPNPSATSTIVDNEVHFGKEPKGNVR